ncbi:MAG: hypothetical protein V3V78_01290 [Candidatus Woesearchaeota archaeon]
MTEEQCQQCGFVVQEIDDGEEGIDYYVGVCPSCGYDPYPDEEDEV